METKTKTTEKKSVTPKSGGFSTSNGASAKVYNQQGKEVGVVALSEKVFGARWNADLVHQVVVSMQANARPTVAHTKNRGEVRGGGRKPWQQKGTGRGRHGSIRSPLWRGGGITFGPRAEKSYKKKINKKMRTKALLVALSEKLRRGHVFFVDKIEMEEIKTKKATQVLHSLGKIPRLEKFAESKKRQTCITHFGQDKILEKSFGNIPSVYLTNFKDINPSKVLICKNIIITKPEDSLGFLKTKL